MTLVCDLCNQPTTDKPRRCRGCQKNLCDTCGIAITISHGIQGVVINLCQPPHRFKIDVSGRVLFPAECQNTFLRKWKTLDIDPLQSHNEQRWDTLQSNYQTTSAPLIITCFLLSSKFLHSVTLREHSNRLMESFTNSFQFLHGTLPRIRMKLVQKLKECATHLLIKLLYSYRIL